MRIYPKLMGSKSDDFKKWIEFATQERVTDVNAYNALPNTYVKGRSVTKIPTSSTDNASSFAGDFNATTSGLLYIAVNEGSTITWRKFTGSTF